MLLTGLGFAFTLLGSCACYTFFRLDQGYDLWLNSGWIYRKCCITKSLNHHLQDQMAGVLGRYVSTGGQIM